MKKIKLAHVQLLPLLSGAQNVMLTLLENLDRDKYEMFVISKPGGPLVKKVNELGFQHLPIPSLRRELSLMDCVAFLHLFLIFRKKKIDIVHTHSSKTGFLGRIAAKLAGIKKIIHTVHGFPFHDAQSFPIRFFYQALEKFVSPFCDKMVFVNDFEREFAVNRKIVNTEKAITIYNGTELNLASNKRKIPNSESEFIIGSVLRFEKIKNIENTIRAAINVCKKNKKLIFYFIGDGKLLKICRQLVIEAELEDNIVFPGWQNNIREWLIKFDVYLLFSIAEGLSISILEAMSMGLPIVASNVKGNNELVSQKNGVLIPINDIDKLTEILLSLPARRKELNAWSAGSCRLIKEKFSLPRFVSRYEKIYEL